MLAVGGTKDRDGACGKHGSTLGRVVLSVLPLAAMAACASAPPVPPASSTASAAEPTRPQHLPQLPRGVQLVGLGSADLQSLLGQPTLVRSEQGAQYWRYSLGNCQLDLFLYADRKAGPARVAYLDVRPSGHVSLAHADACSSAAKVLRGEITTRADREADATGGLPEVETH
ncbi:hypothetical protein [Benzoatithermus flavus]|uniref:Lipoprotein SmpA/OmlA domain-containing protein n=1 Tax=Benzoatithermus flavus TaxID=3108223 RepID=A0ABU8XYX0_9PROT